MVDDGLASEEENESPLHTNEVKNALLRDWVCARLLANMHDDGTNGNYS